MLVVLSVSALGLEDSHILTFSLLVYHRVDIEALS